MLENMLLRSGEPSKYDEAPYGTLCKTAKTMCDTFEIYVQTNLNSEAPHWEFVGVFSKESEYEIQEQSEHILARRKNTL